MSDVVLRHRPVPPRDDRKVWRPAHAQNLPQLLSNEGLDRLVALVEQFGLHRAPHERPQLDAALGRPTWEFATGKTDREDPPPLNSWDHEAKGIEGMRHIGELVPRDNNRRRRILDRTQSLREVAGDIPQEGRGRMRGQSHDHRVTRQFRGHPLRTSRCQPPAGLVGPSRQGCHPSRQPKRGGRLNSPRQRVDQLLHPRGE